MNASNAHRIAVFALVFAARFSPLSLANDLSFTDSFDGPSLDLNQWVVVALPNAQYSSVIQQYGSVTTRARGTIGTVQSWSPGYTISGAFTLLDRVEHFDVVLRTNLTPTDSYNGRSGLTVNFINDGNAVAIQEHPNLNANWTEVARAPFVLETFQSYEFSIFDDGLNVSVSINGNPVVYGASTFSTGDHLAFNSREFIFTSTQIDWLSVQAVEMQVSGDSAQIAAAVPDGGATGMCLGIAGMAGVFGFMRHRRTPQV